MHGFIKTTITLLIATSAALALAAATAFAQELGSAQSTAETLTLEQAISIALKENRSGKNARLEVGKTQDQTAAARTRRLPNFQLTSSISQPLSTFGTTFEKGAFGTYSGIGPVPSEDTVIQSSKTPTAVVVGQITQPVTQLHRINLQIKQLEKANEISQAQLSAERAGNCKRREACLLRDSADTGFV